MARIHGKRQSRGVTLVELLCATAVIGLILAVLASAYFVVVRVCEFQLNRQQPAEIALEAAEVLIRDFMCALAPENHTNPPLRLSVSSNQSMEHCVFYTALPSTPAHSPRLYKVREVQLTVRESVSSGALILERAIRSVEASSNNISTLETWAPLRTVNLEVYDGTAWTNTWESPDLPYAVRLELGYGVEGTNQITMETPIPAGIPFPVKDNALN